MSATFYFGTHRKQDIDNFHKLWMDACTGIVWEDDLKTRELILRLEYGKEDLRIDLVISTEELAV